MSADAKLSRREFLGALGVGAAAVACVREAAEGPAAPKPAGGAPALRVDVWHDTVCPWCRIGCHNLGRALDDWKGPPVEVVFHPFLLEPDAPPEGVDLRERLATKYGATPEGMFERVTRAGAQYGVTFAWDRVRVMPSTVRSHALLSWTPPARQRAVLERIHAAYFDEGRNLGDVEVLAAIAKAAGLDAVGARAAVRDQALLARVRSDARSASESGIDGVPHFRLAGRALGGAQSPAALREALELAARG